MSRMRFLVRALLVLIAISVVGLGGAYFIAGRQPGSRPHA